MGAIARCQNCQITIDTPVDQCPLCGGGLLEKGGEEMVYPLVDYPHRTVKIIHRLSFLGMLLLLGTIGVDFFIARTSLWQWVAVLGFGYLGVSLLYSRKARQSVGYTLLRTVVVTAGIAVAVDVSTGFHRWSTSYLIPILVIAASFAINLILLMKPKWFRDYFVYQVTLCTLGVLTVLLWLLGLVSTPVPVQVATFYSIFTFLILFLFYGRRSLHEMKKRLHF